MNKRVLLFAFLLVVAACARAQTNNDSIPAVDSSKSETSLSFSLNAYLQQHQSTIWSPSASFSNHHFYSSFRYNFEALHTATITGGYEFEGGDKTWYSITPLLGFSFGNYKGISPEAIGLLGFDRFAFVLDGEYSVSLTDSVNALFMLQAGAYYIISSWIFGGINFQRSRIIEPLNNIDAGITLGFLPGNFCIQLQANRFWSSQPYFEIGLSYFINPKNSYVHRTVSPLQTPANRDKN